MRRFGLLAVLLLLPTAAQAYTFSFGDSIAATDDITSITLAADDGTGGNTFEFTTFSDRIVITSSVTQINFSNRAAITGIPIGDLLFSSTVFLNGSYTFTPFVNPTETFADFTNGLADFTIWDDPLGTPVNVLSGDYQGNGLRVGTKIQTGVLLGELSGDYDVIGGEADVVSAFGSTGSIDQVFAISVSTGSSLCGQTISCAPLGPPGFFMGVDWIDFEANPTSTLLPTEVPEPGLALLLATVGAAALIGRARR